MLLDISREAIPTVTVQPIKRNVGPGAAPPIAPH